MTCTVPEKLQGTLNACKFDVWVKKESEVVDTLYESFTYAAAAMLVTLDPPPPADPIVEFLKTLVPTAISKYYYGIGDPIGVTLDDTKWQQVVNAFTWALVSHFYDREDWN